MKRLIAMYTAALCLLSAAACAVDNPSGVSEGSEEQAVTTAPIDRTFANGCRVIFWCHNDQAGGRPAFCTLNSACDGTTLGRVNNLCSISCSNMTNCSITNIQSFGVCN